jgi:hypothetical protein
MEIDHQNTVRVAESHIQSVINPGPGEYVEGGSGFFSFTTIFFIIVLIFACWVLAKFFKAKKTHML